MSKRRHMVLCFTEQDVASEVVAVYYNKRALRALVMKYDRWEDLHFDVFDFLEPCEIGRNYAETEPDRLAQLASRSNTP